MQTHAKHVAIIGAGIAGLTAAVELARLNVDVSLFEKTQSPGGHAAQLSCKAAPDCAKCGACLVDEKVRSAALLDAVHLFAEAQITGARWDQRISLEYTQQSSTMGDERHPVAMEVDAVLLTTGFSPFNPASKPYGYERFKNVITSLDAERRLRKHGMLTRPSDQRPAQRIAFIQCVGSRDSSLGHPWCSKICCGSSLRMARLVQSRQSCVEVTCFYIDVQTFGKDFGSQYPLYKEDIRMVRAVPGDVMGTQNDDLKVTYFDTIERKAAEALFDLVVLSIGLIPSPENKRLADIFGLKQNDDGFLQYPEEVDTSKDMGIFIAGTVSGPMSIAESIGSAERAVMHIARYLNLSDCWQASVTR